ncbi:hypothetical protein GCM10010273_18630 [Streptomyces lavendulocolor]
MDHALTSASWNARSRRASDAGRVPGRQGGATAVMVDVSTHEPSPAASSIRYSVATAPDRWL